MESDTSLTAATVPKFLLRFSKRNSPNGCSPRLLPAIRSFGGKEREELRSFPGPSIIGVSPPGINRRRAFRIGLRCTTRIMSEHSSTDKVGFDSKSPDERLLPAKYRGGPRTPHHAGVRPWSAEGASLLASAMQRIKASRQDVSVHLVRMRAPVPTPALSGNRRWPLVGDLLISARAPDCYTNQRQSGR